MSSIIGASCSPLTAKRCEVDDIAVHRNAQLRVEPGPCFEASPPHIREVRQGSDKSSRFPFPWPGTTRHTSYGSPRHCGYHHVASRPASNAARDVGFLKERYPDVTQKLSRVIFNTPSCCNLDTMDGIIIIFIIIDVQPTPSACIATSA